MMAHLWTPSSKRAALSPQDSAEYLSKQMCQLYHCLPSQLDNEDWERVLTHWEMEQAERWVENERKKAQAEAQRKQAAKARARARAQGGRGARRR